MSNFEYRKITAEDKRRIVEDIYYCHPEGYRFSDYALERLKKYTIDIAICREYESYIFYGMHVHAGATIVKDYTFFYRKSLFLIEEISSRKKELLTELHIREQARPLAGISNLPIGQMNQQELQEMETCLIDAYLYYNNGKNMENILLKLSLFLVRQEPAAFMNN